MWSTASSVRGIVAEMRQIHTEYRVLWRKRDGTATISRGEHLRVPWPIPQGESTLTLALTGFYWLNLHKNAGHICKAQSLLGSKDQTIDNIQRTMRAYSESGSDS